MTKYKKRNYLFLLVVILVCISIGYAILTANVRINGFSKIHNNSWDIHFENIIFNENNVELSNEDSQAEIDSTTRTDITYMITLNQPGDFYEFTVDVVNAGGIDGMIETITSKLNGEDIDTLPNYLLYSITYSDDVELAPKQILRAGETETYKVRVEFKKDIEASDLVDELQTLEFSFGVVYVQADNSAIDVDRPILYNVLEKAAKEGTYAIEYTGSHKDSFTEPAIRKIYHWYTEDDEVGNEILEKNNVLFANHCFQMIRTTDTGGVKMIYNGEAVDGKCLNTRGNQVGYYSISTPTLSSNYWYGTDYTYDSTNQTFKVSGTLEQKVWNATNGPNLIGKYTCQSTDKNGTCSTLYLIASNYNTTSPYAILLRSNSHYSQFGILPFNENYNSLSYVGYMYGDNYPNATTAAISNQSFTAKQTVLQSTTLGTNYWYSDSIDYGTNTANRYSLVEPFKVNGTADYPSLAQKYTFRSTNQSNTGTSVYYIAGVNGNNMYYKQIKSGNLLSAYEPIIIGNAIHDNEDDTYTLEDTLSVSLADWYLNFENYNNKYICDGASVTCSNPHFITATTATDYTYINALDKIVIGKSRNGVSLSDTIAVTKDDWRANYENYQEYKYTCNSDSSTCTEANLRVIDTYNATGYSYAVNRYFGSSVTWDGTNYTLVDPIGLESYNDLDSLSTHHFFCVSVGNTVCSSVAFMYSYKGTGNIFYITLKNGVTTVDEAIHDMLDKNTHESMMKKGIEAWYKHYLINYDEFIEDTVFCGDKSVLPNSGWSSNGGKTDNNLYFYGVSSGADFSCSDNLDRFSVSNPEAKLNYKVGLLSSEEISSLNSPVLFVTGQHYWEMTPAGFSDYYSLVSFVYKDDSRARGFNSLSTNVSIGVRPSISLKPGIRYSSGDGSMANPYVAKTD